MLVPNFGRVASVVVEKCVKSKKDTHIPTLPYSNPKSSFIFLGVKNPKTPNSEAALCITCGFTRFLLFSFLHFP